MFRTLLDRRKWEVNSSQCYEVPRLVLLDYLEKRFDELRANGKTVCLIDSRDGRQISQLDLVSKSKSLAAFFQRAGLRPTDLVCFCGTNCVESVVAFLALLFMQCTVVMVKPVQNRREIRSLLERLPVRAAVSFGEHAASLLDLTATIPSLNLVVFDLGNTDVWTLSADSFVRPPTADPEQTIAFIASTSGSTGPPKLVQQSHFSYIATCWYIQGVHPSAQGVGLSVVPLSHMSGVGMLIAHLTSGSPYVLVEESEIRNSDSKLFDLCEKYRIEQCMLMPVMLKMLANSADSARRRQLSTVTYINTGGSVVDNGSVEKIFSTLPNVKFVYNFYGMSECSVIGISVASREQPAEKLAWLEAGCNTSLKVGDLVTGEAVAPGTAGELLIRSPAVAFGYFDDPEATASTFIRGAGRQSLTDRWLRSGDLAVMDEAGRFRILDRIKDMIKCLDCQVMPFELEHLLRRFLSHYPSSLVSQISVVGIPHEKYTEAPTVFAVPGNEVGTDVDQLRRLSYQMLTHIDENCAYYKRLYGGVIFIRSLPKTPSGKFSKSELRSRHLAGTLDYVETVEYVST